MGRQVRVSMWVVGIWLGLDACSPGDPEMPSEPTTDPSDIDGDEVFNEDDNCLRDFNPDQADLDGDGIGDACDEDTDGDDVPDDHDPSPLDADWPVTVLAESVYAHSATTLYRFDVVDRQLETIGPFRTSESITDLAIDRFGVLYVMSFTSLLVCHPETAECRRLGTLDSDSNGLTFVPAGFVASSDALIGISAWGGWSWLALRDGRIQTTRLGSYGRYTSSGDAFSIAGVGTFASVNGSFDNDLIIEVDPATGAFEREVVELPYANVWGLAGWEGVIFAFDESGDVLGIDPQTGEWSLIDSFDVAWWGAGVTTEVTGVLAP